MNLREDSASIPVSAMEEPIAPPRRNGELTFEAPWESRAFGMAVALNEQGAYEWNAFSTRLAEHLAQIQESKPSDRVLPTPADTESRYYNAWLATLQELLVERGLISAAEIDEMTVLVASGALDHRH